MKYLKPHLYLQNVYDGNGNPEHYELTVVLYCEDNLTLKEIKPVLYSQSIPGNDPRYTDKKQTVIDIVFEDCNTIIPTFNKPIELFFDLEAGKMDNPETTEVRVQVNAIHPIPVQDHNGSSTAHLGDPD